MAPEIELLYILKKHKGSDRFDSELPIRIPLADEIEFLVSAQMEAAAPNAVMGVWQTDSTSLMTFVRQAQLAPLDLPDLSKIRKVRFRILTHASLNGQQHQVAFAYEINQNRCDVVPAGPLPGQNWVALVSLAGNQFRLQHRKPGGGPGGDNPCAELNCHNSPDWVTLIKCWRNNCP